ncbi:MAG: hypothetical protein IJZ47_01530 [Oscillospiraceae bacterium]|nr:hypothetical protein [Oscillospiraceae bacterium]
MKKMISVSRARSRKLMLRGVLRWLIYAALLLLFYVWETNPLIRGFCPLLIIPLATSVAMREGELAAGIFGACCGLMLDLASGTILGFSSLWLLVFCPVLSLLSQFLVKSNCVSHLVLNFGVTLVMLLMDLLFVHWVWERGEAVIAFRNELLPAYLGAVIGSVPVYFVVRFIHRKLRFRTERKPEESSLTKDDKADIVRE